jgi:hypothetical protein
VDNREVLWVCVWVAPGVRGWNDIVALSETAQQFWRTLVLLRSGEAVREIDNCVC